MASAMCWRTAGGLIEAGVAEGAEKSDTLRGLAQGNPSAISAPQEKIDKKTNPLK